jgi:hypothetical protein
MGKGADISKSGHVRPERFDSLWTTEERQPGIRHIRHAAVAEGSRKVAEGGSGEPAEEPPQGTVVGRTVDVDCRHVVGTVHS